jgi:hypothetical protein
MLTNATIDLISQYCPQLIKLSVFACMFSSAAIQRLLEAPCAKELRHLNIGRCHLIDLAHLSKDMPSLCNLEVLQLASLDSVLPLQLVGLVKKMKRLKMIDVSDCIEICRKDVQAIQRLRPTGRLTIIHTSRMDDFTPASIRAYLLSISGIPTH